MKRIPKHLLAGVLLLAACGGSKPAQKEDAPANAAVPAAQVVPTPEPVARPVPEPVVVELPDPQAPVVSVRLVFKAGSVDDPAGQEGITSLLAEVMEQATQKLENSALQKALFPFATGIGSYVDAETSVFTMTVHRDVAALALPHLMDVVASPRMDAKDFERVRKDTITALETHLRQADDEDLGKAALQQFLWKGHPYGRIPQGSVASLKALTLEQLQTQRLRLFTRARLVVGLGGAYSPEVAAAVKAGVARLPAGEAWDPVVLPNTPQAPGIHVHIIQKDTASSPITMGYRYGLTRNHPDFFAMMVANSAFGEHRQMGGRLFYRMREVRGLNYGDYSYLEHFSQEGWDTLALLNIPRRQQAFTIWLRPVEPDDRVFALRQALRELQVLAKDGITQEEFQRTRGFLLGYSLLWEQGTSRRLGYAMDDVLNGTPGFLAALRAKLATLTVEEVNAAIQRHMRADMMEVTMLAKDAPALRDQLLSGAASPRPTVKTKNQDAATNAEDLAIANHPLGLTAKDVDITPVQEMFAQ